MSGTYFENIYAKTAQHNDAKTTEQAISDTPFQCFKRFFDRLSTPLCRGAFAMYVYCIL